MFSRTGKCAAAVVAGALVLAACGSDDNDGGGSAGGGGSTEASGEPIKWGINAELSGPLAFYGTTIAGGVKAYVEQVNAEGGIDGHPIELVELDNAGEQSRAAANATQLVTADEVVAIFGNTLSTNCAAAQPIVERYKVPMACRSVAEYTPYVFSLSANSGRAGSSMIATAQDLVDSDPIDTAVLSPTTLTGQAQKEYIEEHAEEEGLNLVSVQDFEVTAADLSPQIANIVAADPEVILMSSTGPGLVTVLRGLRAAGEDAPVVWSEGTANLNSLAESTDPAVYALTVHELIDPETAEGAAAEFVEAVTPQLEGEVTKVSVNGGDYVSGYSTARLFGEALKECGADCTGEDLQKQLEQTQIELPGIVEGEFGYDGDDHYPWPNWYVHHIVGTDWETIGTYESAG